jgi:hypothetical protein
LGGFFVSREENVFTDFDFEEVIRMGKAKYSAEAFSAAVFALDREGIILDTEGVLRVDTSSFLFLDSKKVYSILAKYMGKNVDSLKNTFFKEIQELEKKLDLFLGQGKETSDLEMQFARVLSDFFIVSFFYKQSDHLYSVDYKIQKDILSYAGNGVAICLRVECSADGVLIEMISQKSYN